MPDITMCEGNECPLKESCYRYKAEADQYQCYFVDIPLQEDGTCDYFIEIWSKPKTQNNEA